METDQLHQTLVDGLKGQGLIVSPQVEAAFRAVPRHLFLPDVAVDEVYHDAAIVTKRVNDQPVSSSSQPAIMAIMLEQLELKPGQRILEIGAGTGYNAALMAQIAGDAGRVITVDIDQDIVDDARQHLVTAGFDRVQVICGDGGTGYADAAPYDRIILTVGAADIAPAWREQLSPTGRLLLPLSIKRTQASVAFDRANDHLASASVRDCSFMMLRGAFAGAGQSAQLGPEAGLHFIGDTQNGIDMQTLYQLLVGPSRDWSTAIQVTEREVWGGLSLWLDLHEPGFCSLWAEGELAARGLIPRLFTFPGSCETNGLASKDGLGLLMRPPDSISDKPAPSSFELWVRNYGPHDTLAQHLIEHVAAWDAAGRPGTDRLRVRAYPSNMKYLPSGDEIVIQKRWTQLVLDWKHEAKRD
jgi:protein-L-isoaspartate(D-aspartate) O-methyltransferase